MPSGDQDDSGFFIGTGQGAEKPAGEEAGGREDTGASSEARPNPGDPGQVATEGSFFGGGSAGEDPPKKKRGRPPGSKTKNRAAQDSFGLNGPVASKEEEAKKLAPEVASAIYSRHLMIAMALGWPELKLDEDKSMALALAWVRFQQEYPQTKIARKTQVVIDLATATGLAYLPMLGAVGAKARQAAANRKPKGPQFPVKNPAMQPDGSLRDVQAGPNGLNGNGVIIPTGAPDAGKIKFE